MSYVTDKIRNVAIAGHGWAGKTTLLERLLFAGGAIDKAQTVESGKTVGDSAEEEVERKISIHAALAHVLHGETKINFFDTPGSPDFGGDVILSFRASELALLAVDARAGAQIETVKLWRRLDEDKKPRCIFVTKLDSEQADFGKNLADIKEKFKIDPVPVSFPMGKGPGLKGVVDVLHGKAYLCGGDNKEKECTVPNEYAGQAAEAREKLVEAAAEGSDELMEKFIGQGTLSDDEIKAGLVLALAQNKYVPVFAGSALAGSGLLPLLDFIAEAAPCPKHAKDIAKDSEGNEHEVAIDPEKPFSAFALRTSYDQFSGKLTWLKIVTGKLTADSECFNISEGKKEKIGKLYICQGKKLEETRELFAGDVGLVAKSPTLKTGDTLCAVETGMRFAALKLPTPVHSVAVNAAAKKDDDKLGEFLTRAGEEDKTFRCRFNSETKETVISGMGELQIGIILDKIRHSQKIEIETHVPHVAYRETVTKKAAAEHTHKKQTGGHGQYGKVLLEVSPLPRGEKYQFVNAIFGGAIPKNYIPGVEKGVQEGMAHGTMASYPVVDVEVKIVDGKYHPVDSSELSFKLAARNAFREAMRQAGPVLLEPVADLTVFVEEKFMGEVMSDLSGKRGKIHGQDCSGGIAEIRAEVPQAELLRYSIDLRSITSGTGSFSAAFSHYAPITGRIADDVVKARETFKVQELDD